MILFILFIPLVVVLIVGFLYRKDALATESQRLWLLAYVILYLDTIYYSHCYLLEKEENGQFKKEIKELIRQQQ